MPRRLALASFALLLVVGSAHAQVSFDKNAIPGRRALARVNLDLHFSTVVPLYGAEKVTQISIDDGMLFAQTNHGNFYAMDGETGRALWGAHLGDITTKSTPVSVNSYAVYVTNSNTIYALDRKTGRQIWTQQLTDIPSSSTASDDSNVMVGLESGKLVAFNARNGKPMWNFHTNRRISSHPILASKIVVFASEDKKVYLSRAETPEPIWRFATGGAIVAPLGTHGVRTLLVPSTDHSLYAVDLFTGEGKWTFTSDSPIEQEPLVSGDDVYVVNDTGILNAVDVKTGQEKWETSTLGGRLLSVSKTKVYLESHEDDLFVVDRAIGKVIYDTVATFNRAGVNLRDFILGPTNRYDDRLYFGTSHGLIIALREISQVKPLPVRDPNEKPFGYVPPEGYPDAPPLPPVVPFEPNGAGGTATPPAGGTPDAPPTDPK